MSALTWCLLTGSRVLRKPPRLLVATVAAIIPVTGLTRDDFELNLEGEPVEILSVSAAEDLRETVSGRLTLLLFIDERHLQRKHRDTTLAEIADARWGTLLFGWEENSHGMEVEIGRVAGAETGGKDGQTLLEVVASLPIGELELASTRAARNPVA